MKAFNIEDVLFLDIETTPANNQLQESDKVICICVGKFGQDSRRFLNLRAFYNENETKLLHEFNSFMLNFSKQTILCFQNGVISPAILNKNSYLNDLKKLDATEFISGNNIEITEKNQVSVIEPEDIVLYCFNNIVAIAQILLRFKNLSSVSTENIYYV